MGQISKALGEGSSFEHQGKTYNLSPWTYEIQAKFEKYLEAEAVKAARRMKPHLLEEDFRELLRGVNQDIASGVYTFGSETVARAIQTSLSHFQVLLLLMLQPNHPEVNLDWVKAYTKEKLDEAMDAVSRANAPDPTNPPEAPAENP